LASFKSEIRQIQENHAKFGAAKNPHYLSIVTNQLRVEDLFG
jgi:hypothetical protein